MIDGALTAFLGREIVTEFRSSGLRAGRRLEAPSGFASDGQKRGRRSHPIIGLIRAVVAGQAGLSIDLTSTAPGIAALVGRLKQGVGRL